MIHLNRANFPNEFVHNGSCSEGNTLFFELVKSFSVTSFKKRYYCSKVSLENLKFHLKSFHGFDSTIFVCVNHVIVKEVNGELSVLPSEQSLIGKVCRFSSSLHVSIFFHCSLQSPRACFSGHLYTYSQPILMCTVWGIDQGFCCRENSLHFRDHHGWEGKLFQSMAAQFVVLYQNRENPFQAQLFQQRNLCGYSVFAFLDFGCCPVM